MNAMRELSFAKAFKNAFSYDISSSEHASAGSRMMGSTRREVFEYLCMFPCSSISEISRSISRSMPTVEWHLRRLLADRYISAKRSADKIVYYPIGLLEQNDLALIVFLNMKSARMVLNYITCNPGTTQKEIVCNLGMGSANASKITKKLAALNLVAVIIDGKFRRYYPSDYLEKLRSSICERVKGFKKSLLDRLACEGMNPVVICGNCGAHPGTDTSRCEMCKARFNGLEDYPTTGDEAEGKTAYVQLRSKKSGLTKAFLRRWDEVKETKPDNNGNSLDQSGKLSRARSVKSLLLVRKARLLALLERYDEALEVLESPQLAGHLSEERHKSEVLGVLSARHIPATIQPEQTVKDRRSIVQALRHYNRLLIADPMLEKAWLTKGELLAKLGRYQEADACFDRAMDVRSAKRKADKRKRLPQ